MNDPGAAVGSPNERQQGAGAATAADAAAAAAGGMHFTPGGNTYTLGGLPGGFTPQLCQPAGLALAYNVCSQKIGHALQILLGL